MSSAPQLKKAVQQLTGGVNSLLKRAEKTDARLDAVYDQGTNLAKNFQAEATKNESRHAETTGRIGDLKRTVIQARIEDNKLRRKEETRRDELRREEETRRDEQQLADLEADEREKEAERNREREQQQYFLKGLEAAVGASRAAADTAKENKAMLTVALEQRTPVKGTPVKGPVRGQGTPTPLSTRVVSAAKQGLAKLSPSASCPLPKAPPGRAKPERRGPAARGQSQAGAATPKPRTPVFTRGQRTPATLTPGLRAPLSARVKSGVASAASAVAKLSPVKVGVCQKS